MVETATARNPHHFAVLIGYGATAVYPYLAYQCIDDLIRGGQRRHADTVTEALHYRRGINKGLYKILSKMGISTIASYRGAQLFEAVGLHAEVVDLCFTGTPWRMRRRLRRARGGSAAPGGAAWRRQAPIDPGGLFKYVYGGEYHAFNPDVVQTLQRRCSRATTRPTSATRRW